MNAAAATPQTVPPENFTVEGILATLRRMGMRLTASRRVILRVLFAASNPLSLQEIQDTAKSLSGFRPDYATVFRLMVQLEELGIVSKVNLQRSCSYFELHNPSKHYDHLICRICGNVTLLQIPCPVQNTEKMLREKYGFTSLTHSLDFFGVCPDCQKQPVPA